MIDVHYQRNLPVLVKPKQHPVVAVARAAVAGEIAPRALLSRCGLVASRPATKTTTAVATRSGNRAVSRLAGPDHSIR
ncbi:MAG: hypothetical protein WKF47_15040 [Geodermatophilaceae bacterium]